MRAMTCRGAMLVTLLLVATAASTHGARGTRSLADRLREARGRSFDSGLTSEDVTVSSVSIPSSPVLIDDEEDQTIYAPEEEMEEIVDPENPKVKPRPKPKNSLMQRTRDKMNRRRAQSRYGTNNDRRNGGGPTRERLTPRPRTTTTLPPRRRPTPRWRQRHRKTTSTSTLEPINISEEQQPSIPTAQTAKSTTTFELITISTKPQSRKPTAQTTTSTITLEPITISTEPQSIIPTTQTTTSISTSQPTANSTEPQASILTTKFTKLATSQMTTSTTKADSTYSPEITEAITLTTPADLQSSTTSQSPRRRFIPRWRRTTSSITLTKPTDLKRSTTPQTPRIRFIPRWRRTTTAHPTTTTTSTTTLQPITKSTEPRSTEADSTYPTEIPEDVTLTTPVDSQSSTTSTTTLQPITKSTEPRSTEVDSTYPTEITEDVTLTTPVDSQSSTTPLTPKRRFIPLRRRTTTTNPITTTTSTTTLQPITKSTESRSTESDSTYPTEITEDITLTTPAYSQSSTTPLTPKRRFIPHERRTTITNPTTTTTSTTTLQPITKSTEPSSTESDSTYPTEIIEDIILTTPADSQNTLNKKAINTDDSFTTTTTTTTTTERSTTATAPFPSTEAISQEIQTTEETGRADPFPTTEAISQDIQTTEEAGHAGEVFPVEEEDIPNLKIPKPLKKHLKKTFIPKPVIVGSGLSVGAGINIEDPEFDLERVGPVLIIGNSLRKRRQHHAGDNITDGTDSLATVEPVETTINPFNDDFDENDFETTLGPISFNRRRSSTASPSTINESPQNLPDANDTTIEANPDPEVNLVIETANGGSFPDFQEITVGTKVNLGGPERRPVTGEVIPVELESKSELEKEHKISEVGIPLNENTDGPTTLVSDKPERPSSPGLLGSLLNYFTQSRPERPERPDRPERPNRPRPDRPQVLRPERPVTRQGERPEFRPFRPRPRPSGSRPDILPPRQSSPPNIPEINSDSSTNRPVDSTIFPEDYLGDELPSRSTAVPLRVSNFRPRPTGLLNKPSRPSSLLPSKPIIESGFQGIPGENGEPRPAVLFRPGAEEIKDYDYDADALPPSLPNLKIIPFVAADALTHQQGGNIDSFTGDDFRISPQDKAVTTTAKPITTERSTRRPLPAIGTRRPPILPPRRPQRPDGNRPSPFRQRPSPFRQSGRPSFIPPRTTPKDKITSEENRIAPSTTAPFRLRFTTTEKSLTAFTLASVEKTTELVRSEPEEDITTDDLPITESITVLTPEAPLRLPGPIRPTFASSQSSSVSSSSSKPIKTDDISNLFLQDIFGHPEGTTRAPVRFIPASNKPVILKKTPAPLPAIPSLITNLFPLAPDPIVAQGLLKLSGCNIYGRMYQVDDRIKELSAECKECRCTPVGVQCLPVCA